MIEESDADRRVQIGEYVLGLLEGAERAEVHALIERDRVVAAMALAWEDDFLALASRIATQTPSPVVWTRIRSVLGLPRDQPAAAQPQSSRQRHALQTGNGCCGWWDSVIAWRWLTVSLATAALVLAVMPDRSPQGPPAHIHMAVLQAPGEAAKPGWVVTVQANGDVVLDPLVPVAVAPGRSVELWTLVPNEQRPRSLGLVAAGQPVHLPASIVGPVQPNQLFEMTLEP